MRRASVIFAIASIIIPAALMYLSTLEAEREVQARGGPICGLPFFADFILASFVCILLSAVAFILGAIAYRRAPAPRPRRRLFELAALVLPLVIVGGYAASFFIAF
jgi:hypothetical protein